MKATIALEATVLISIPAYAADVPARLPDLDGEPGSITKPVKVYILAGQSNMVGMGNISGATGSEWSMKCSSPPSAAAQTNSVRGIRQEDRLGSQRT